MALSSCFTVRAEHGTHTDTQAESPGACLVEETKVGRSIQESPLTLLPLLLNLE